MAAAAKVRAFTPLPPITLAEIHSVFMPPLTPAMLDTSVSFIRTAMPDRLRYAPHFTERLTRAARLDESIVAPLNEVYLKEADRLNALDPKADPLEVTSVSQSAVENIRTETENLTKLVTEPMRLLATGDRKFVANRALTYVWRTLTLAGLVSSEHAAVAQAIESGYIVDPQLPVTKAQLDIIVEDIVEDVTGFCIEKYGDSSQVNIHCGPKEYALCVPSLVYFSIGEILKNAMRASIEACEITLDEPAPIDITISGDKQHVGIVVDDKGVGMSPEVAGTAFHFFSTKTPERDPTYTYSGDFGSAFSGHGVGLALARLYAGVHGGNATAVSVPGVGTKVAFVIDRKGIGGGWT